MAISCVRVIFDASFSKVSLLHRGVINLSSFRVLFCNPFPSPFFFPNAVSLAQSGSGLFHWSSVSVVLSEELAPFSSGFHDSYHAHRMEGGDHCVTHIEMRDKVQQIEELWQNSYLSDPFNSIVL